MNSRIKPGEVIGTVADHLGNECEDIISTQAGLVICLRVFNRVHEGESLAAILEIDDEHP